VKKSQPAGAAHGVEVQVWLWQAVAESAAQVPVAGGSDPCGSDGAAGEEEAAGAKDAGQFVEGKSRAGQMFDDVKEDDNIGRGGGEGQRLVKITLVQFCVAALTQQGGVNGEIQASPDRLRNSANKGFNLADTAADINDRDGAVIAGHFAQQGGVNPPVAEGANWEACGAGAWVDDGVCAAGGGAFGQ